MPYRHYFFCPKCAQLRTVGNDIDLSQPLSVSKAGVGSHYKTYINRSLSFDRPDTDRPDGRQSERKERLSTWQHFDLDKQARCQQHLIYLGWEEIKPASDRNTIVVKAVQTVRNYRSHETKTGVGVVCACYDPVTGLWHQGVSGPATKHRGSIPAKVWGRIQNVYDEEKLIFGRGCAEVDALDKLFKARVNANVDSEDLQECVMAARMKSIPTLRAMCNNCQRWATPLGIIDAVALSRLAGRK